VKVRRGSTIRGTVADASGRPLDRGEVRIEPSPFGDPRPSRDGHVRPDGTFEIGGLEKGLHDLSILVHPEFLQEVVRGVEADGKPVKVVLRRSGGIVGRVVPPEGAGPGEQAEVTVRALGDTFPLPPDRTGRVPLGGNFRIGPLAPGPYAVSVVAGDRRADHPRLVVDDGGALDLGDIELTSPAGVVGGALRVAGHPAAGVAVEVLRVHPEGRFESVRRVLSGPDGRWKAEGLLEGDHVAVVRPQDRPLVEAAFHCLPGEPATLDLEVPAGGSLLVKVVDGEGKPVAGARIVLQGDSGSIHFWKAGDPGPGPHRTGPGGALRCTGIPAGRCRVTADLPGSGSGEAEAGVAEGGEGAVEVVLEGR